MKLHDLKSHPKKPKTRVGRGIAAGGGKTAGRGTKGQRSRTGKKFSILFEGGQTPLHMRVPKKRGRRHRKSPVYTFRADSMNRLWEHLGDGEKITPKTFKDLGMIPALGKVKIIGPGKLPDKVQFTGISFSKTHLKERGTKQKEDTS